MYYRCMNYMCDTPKYSRHVLPMYDTCHIHVAHFLVYLLLFLGNIYYTSFSL